MLCLIVPIYQIRSQCLLNTFWSITAIDTINNVCNRWSPWQRSCKARRHPHRLPMLTIWMSTLLRQALRSCWSSSSGMTSSAVATVLAMVPSRPRKRMVVWLATRAAAFTFQMPCSLQPRSPTTAGRKHSFSTGPPGTGTTDRWMDGWIHHATFAKEQVPS